jgi:hypothetical protein
MATPGVKDYDREHPPCARPSLGSFSSAALLPRFPLLWEEERTQTADLAMSGIPLPPRSA